MHLPPAQRINILSKMAALAAEDKPECRGVSSVPKPCQHTPVGRYVSVRVGVMTEDGLGFVYIKLSLTSCNLIIPHNNSPDTLA